MIMEYIVFFGLLAFGIIIFLFHLYQPKESQLFTTAQIEYNKCESYIERRLFNAMKFNGYDVKAQYIVPPRKYRIDLALPQYKIAIECDGKDFHSSPASKTRDRRKSAYLRSKGWTVLRFSGSAINGNIGNVLKRIDQELKKVTSV